MKHRVFVFSLFLIYILGMTAFMIWQGVGIAPDRYAFVLLLVALVVKRTRSFLFDWLPFLFIWITYDFLRGFADNLDPKVHYLEPIQADLALFGFNPVLKLQQVFYHPEALKWYDYLATIFYFLHFALAESFAFFLWLYSRARFREFVSAILILSYAGWVTYVIYPAAPPWLANKQGLLPGITKILDQTLQAFPDRLNLPTIYHDFNPNQVAAIPSMHAAYPFLVLLFLIYYYRLRGLLFLPYVLGVWISIVYLGEHYVIDIVWGVVYSLFAFLVAKWLIHNVKFQSAILDKIKMAVRKTR